MNTWTYHLVQQSTTKKVPFKFKDKSVAAICQTSSKCYSNEIKNFCRFS